MYFLIAGFGHGEAKRVAVKFFLFTMGGSIFFMASMFALAGMYYREVGQWSFGIDTLMQFASTQLSTTTAAWLFFGFAIAFAVKVPLFPLHTWLPDAHTEAPTAGSIILAGVLLKLGTYGFIRIAIAFFPDAAHTYAPILLSLSVIGIIYGAIVATMQPDLKRLIAYSSIAHLGFVVLGIASLTKQGITGSVFTMVSHGLTTGALFALVGMLYDRRHTRDIKAFGGLLKSVPLLGWRVSNCDLRIHWSPRVLRICRRVPRDGRSIRDTSLVRHRCCHRSDLCRVCTCSGHFSEYLPVSLKERTPR
jgi:NADH-quinone oxidoreductase subunit M